MVDCFSQMRSPKEIPKEDYQEFYKKTFNEFLDPLTHAHFTTEVHLCFSIMKPSDQSISSSCLTMAEFIQGEVEFRSVLYIPGMAPLNNEEVINPKTKNIRLYVKRVFISDDFDGELVSFVVYFFPAVMLFYFRGSCIHVEFLYILVILCTLELHPDSVMVCPLSFQDT